MRIRTVMMRALLVALFALSTFARAEEGKRPLRLLMFTLSAGFKHGSIPVAEEVITRLGRESGAFDTVVSQDCKMISAESLSKFDAALFFTSGNLPIDDNQKQALLSFIRNGGAFLGTHSATDCMYNWPDYGEMIGAYFDGHPWTQKITVKVEDPNHPACEALGKSFEIDDEIYQFRNFSRDRVHVLMSLDVQSVDLTRPGVHRTDKDFATTWCREYGKGRVFYTGLGHRDEVWKDPRFQGIMLGGLLWATRTDWRSDERIKPLLDKKDVAGLTRLIEQRHVGFRRLEAVKALGGIDTKQAAAAAGRISATGDDLRLRLTAIKTLGRMKQGGVKELCKRLKDHEPSVRIAACEALGLRKSNAAIRPLSVLRKDKDEAVRAAAFMALGQIGSPAAIRLALDGLKSPDPASHSAAFAALANADPEITRPAYLKLLNNSAESYRALLPDIATRLAPQADREDVFQVLAKSLKSSDPSLRSAAMRSLAGSNRAEVAELIAPLLFDPTTAIEASNVTANMQRLDLSRYLTPFVREWLVIGPFPNEADKGFDAVYPPEQALNWSAKCEGVGGTVGWKRVESKEPVFDFFGPFPDHRENVAAYVFTNVVCDNDLDAKLRIGSDDGVKVWLNGAVVHALNVHRGHVIDQDRVPVKFRKGENSLLIKVTQAGGLWSVSLRVGSKERRAKEVTFRLPESAQ